MKKIINGKKYDTDTAKNLGSARYSYPMTLAIGKKLVSQKTGEFCPWY